MSRGNVPSAADHRGSRCRSNAAAADAHCAFRWAVGTTTMSLRPGSAARAFRAAVRAKVVFPAPGVATARKSGAPQAAKRSSALFCQGRSVTVRGIWLEIMPGPRPGYRPFLGAWLPGARADVRLVHEKVLRRPTCTCLAQIAGRG